MTDRPTFALIGDMNGALAQKVSADVALSPFATVDALSGHGVLVDGTQPNPGDQVLGEILASGRLLAIADANDDERQSLLSLTGQAPADSLPLVTVRQADDGRGVACSVLAAQASLTESVLGPAGTQSSGPTPVSGGDLGPELARAATSPPGTASGSWSVAGFVPPNESTAGYAQVTTSMNWQVPPPTNGGHPDDAVMGTTPQPISSDVVTEFFVYWVNGVGPPEPYFQVIVRQTGPATVGAGSPPFDQPISRGWFQLKLGIGPWEFTDTGGHLLTTGVSRTGYSPADENDSQLSLRLIVPMALWATVGGAPGTYDFSATASSGTPFGGWRIHDETAALGPQWAFVEAQGWDPEQLPPGSKQLLTQLYDTAGNVISLPPQSFGSLSYEALGAWQFVPPASGSSANHFIPPPAFPVTFTSTVAQLVGLAHNPQGCAGAFGEALRHVFSQTYSLPAPPPYTVDLGHIAQLANYPHQN